MPRSIALRLTSAAAALTLCAAPLAAGFRGLTQRPYAPEAAQFLLLASSKSDRPPLVHDDYAADGQAAWAMLTKLRAVPQIAGNFTVIDFNLAPRGRTYQALTGMGWKLSKWVQLRDGLAGAPYTLNGRETATRFILQKSGTNGSVAYITRDSKGQYHLVVDSTQVNSVGNPLTVHFNGYTDERLPAGLTPIRYLHLFDVIEPPRGPQQVHAYALAPDALKGGLTIQFCGPLGRAAKPPIYSAITIAAISTADLNAFYDEEQRLRHLLIHKPAETLSAWGISYAPAASAPPMVPPVLAEPPVSPSSPQPPIVRIDADKLTKAQIASLVTILPLLLRNERHDKLGQEVLRLRVDREGNIVPTGGELITGLEYYQRFLAERGHRKGSVPMSETSLMARLGVDGRTVSPVYMTDLHKPAWQRLVRHPTVQAYLRAHGADVDALNSLFASTSKGMPK